MVDTNSNTPVVRDPFDIARESLFGGPGFVRRNNTVTAPAFSTFPGSDWIIETLKTDDDCRIFLRRIGPDGGQRIVLPYKVVEVIYRQYDSIRKIRRSIRAQRGAETRRRKQVDMLNDENQPDSNE